MEKETLKAPFLAVWSWDGAHRLLVSVMFAGPAWASIEYGRVDARRTKEVPYSALFHPKSGEPIEYSQIQSPEAALGEAAEVAP